MPENYTPVATRADLAPGRMRCVRVGDRRILLANVAGEIFATDELCTHEEHSLCNGALRGETVSCSLHGSRFNVRTGQPQEEPASEPLRTYPVRIEGDAILVGIA